jgi:hypothetical protein
LNTRNMLGFRVTFSYRIGKMSVDQRPVRRKRSINNDDLKDGGGDGGMQMGGETPAPQGNVQGARRQGAPPPAAQRRPEASRSESTDVTTYDVTGTWKYATDSQQGGGGMLVLTKTANEYSGTIRPVRSQEDIKVEEVTVAGNDITFTYPVTFGPNTLRVQVHCKIGKDQMRGTMQTGQRTVNFTAERSQ